MAGIGIELNKIFKKKSLISTLKGIGYSTVVTIAPMLVIILALIMLYILLDYNSLMYAERELLSCSILYTFIFSVLCVSPFNSVISRYLADKIYEEKYDDILPAFYTGLVMTITLSSALALPLCIWEILVGCVEALFVLTTFCMFSSLTVVFYTMIFLSITKDYKKISLFFGIGMIIALLLSVILKFIFGVRVIEAIQYGFFVGFLIIAFCEFGYLRRYFNTNSGNYKGVLPYFKKYWQLIVANFFYTFGLFVHNFVFWTTDMSMTVVRTFVCNQPYDMATCIAMFTNISASVIFIVSVETKFNSRYRKYSESVIGGKLKDIEKAKSRMFRSLSEELITLVQIQFIISVGLFLVFYIFLPQLGLSGLVMEIYPCLAAAYFVVFVMYSLIIFLYYFDAVSSAALTSTVFLLTTLIASIAATWLGPEWNGIGLLIGSLAGFTVAYFKIHRLEKRFDQHIFCRGNLINMIPEKLPDPVAYKKTPDLALPTPLDAGDEKS